MLEAMDAGADDFPAKPFDPPELNARLQVGKRIVELQQKLVSANEALHYAANHDFLARLWNRAAIIAFLQREMARSLREGRALGVTLVDVDHFKNVNDELGHETGDYVLQEIAKRFSASLREYDGIGRYGGEEFLLVMPGCEPRNDITSCQSDQRVDFEYADPDPVKRQQRLRSAWGLPSRGRLLVQSRSCVARTWLCIKPSAMEETVLRRRLPAPEKP